MSANALHDVEWSWSKLNATAPAVDIARRNYFFKGVRRERCRSCQSAAPLQAEGLPRSGIGEASLGRTAGNEAGLQPARVSVADEPRPLAWAGMSQVVGLI